MIIFIKRAGLCNPFTRINKLVNILSKYLNKKVSILVSLKNEKEKHVFEKT